MRLMLDTTYFLPLVGISIKDLPRDALKDLLRGGHEVFVSEVSIFELSAKGAKYVAEGSIPPERVVRGVKAIVYEDRIMKVPIYEGKILRTSFKLKSVLADFIDCIILSSAMARCEVLVTEDKDILKLREDRKFSEIMAEINPTFEIRRISEVL